jgi:hypothetical protein
MYWNTPPSWINEIIFPTSYHSYETYSEQKSYAYFTPVM